MEPLFHLTDQAAWAAAQTTGQLRPPSLSTEGFVHCSSAAQIERVANRFHCGRRDLILLTVDPARLPDPPVWEGPVDPRTGRPETTGPATQERFPHVYGPIPVAAVTDARPWPADADGVFRLHR